MTNPHFAWLPPEINSALMFAGPGAGPLLAAAGAWSGLAEELASSMSSFSSVVAELTNGSWLGPSSAAMMAVATQYMAWLGAAATQAEQVAAQAAATATAFEAALAATVQPAVVAANRGLMQVLAATNWLGFNTPAIMDIEGAYEQMWAMDVAAMAAYHADASAAASLLAPWQQVLRNLGIDIGKNGAINLGFGNTGSGNIGIGNTGSGNLGIGNTGSSNIGGGNTGNNNVGMGNLGNSNLGIGSTGNHDVGVGLTGNNQVGFGGLNSGSGNIGFGNSGTGNVGFFNSGNGNLGIGNSGFLNNGFGNSGNINTGFGNVGGMSAGLWPSVMQGNVPGSAGLDAGLANSASYATGGTATLSSSILSSALGQTGGLHPGLANALNPARPHPRPRRRSPLLPESTPARTPATPMPAPAPLPMPDRAARAAGTPVSTTRATTIRVCATPLFASRSAGLRSFPGRASPSRPSTPAANRPTPAPASNCRFAQTSPN
ncbi:PPE family protein [Mycobacterium kansasii 732]|nr:PPE family protein [Mycobacterium kansasii 732]